MKRNAVLVAVTLLAMAVPAQANEGHEHHKTAHVGAKAAKRLDQARAATKRFRTPAAAKAAGYVLDMECVADPEAGGMGVHAFNERLMADGKLDPRRPEVLVYSETGPDGCGSWRSSTSPPTLTATARPTTARACSGSASTGR